MNERMDNDLKQADMFCLNDFLLSFSADLLLLLRSLLDLIGRDRSCKLPPYVLPVLTAGFQCGEWRLILCLPWFSLVLLPPPTVQNMQVRLTGNYLQECVTVDWFSAALR